MHDRTAAALVETLGRINAFICKCGVVIAPVFITIMTIVVILGVFFSWALSKSLSWVEDLSLVMMETVAYLMALLLWSCERGCLLPISHVCRQIEAFQAIKEADGETYMSTPDEKKVSGIHRGYA